MSNNIFLPWQTSSVYQRLKSTMQRLIGPGAGSGFRAACKSCLWVMGAGTDLMWFPKLRTPLAEGNPPAVRPFCLSSELASKTRHHAGQQRHKYKQVRRHVPKELAALHRLNAPHVVACQNLAEAGGNYLHFTDEETETQRHLRELSVVLRLDQWQRRFLCMSPPWNKYLRVKS